MSKDIFKVIIKSSIWGVISKIVSAFVNFLIIPLLINFYGKEEFGLITLAFSLNAYLKLMDLGMNVGSIRFFSTWIEGREWQKVLDVSRSSVVFYGFIGFINALIFVFISFDPLIYFSLPLHQVGSFKIILYILSCSTIINWLSSVINQLLAANDQLVWLNKTTTISHIANLIVTFICIYYKFSLEIYFLCYTISTLVVIPINILKLKINQFTFVDLLSPKWNGKTFKQVLNYSISIFLMGFFQFSADNLRPLLLVNYAGNGIESLADFRSIQTISLFVFTISSVFLQSLLPSISKLNSKNDLKKVSKLIFNGTKYISIFLSFTIFILILNAENILSLYLGDTYKNLSLWLIIWLLSLLSLHNSPVSSLVLSTGNTKSILIMSAISCIITLPVTALFANTLNVGSAVIGYLFYVVLQMTFYYVYYIPKILMLDSKKLFFGSFLPPTIVGLISLFSCYLFGFFIHFNFALIDLVLNCLLFTLIFTILSFKFLLAKLEKSSILFIIKDFGYK